MENRFKNDPEFNRLLQGFILGLTKRVDAIGHAAKKQEWDKLSLLAHRLKGAASSYGLPNVSECAGELEILALKKISDPKTFSLIEDLSKIVKTLTQ